jgi:hypothetical protein
MEHPMTPVRALLIAAMLAFPLPAVADCASLVASVCGDDAGDATTTPRFIRLPPRPPAYAEGEVFPVNDHNILMNPERYGLPPVDGEWRYYQIEHEVFRVDNATRRVLEVVSDGNRLMIR